MDQPICVYIPSFQPSYNSHQQDIPRPSNRYNGLSRKVNITILSTGTGFGTKKTTKYQAKFSKPDTATQKSGNTSSGRKIDIIGNKVQCYGR